METHTFFKPQIHQSQLRPLFLSRVEAGFPSPAENYVAQELDLNEHLIRHPSATFFMRVTGNSMIEAVIFENDLIIVDRSLRPKHQHIVVAIVNGEFTLKRLVYQDQKALLCPENKNFPPLLITPDMEFEIWGVACFVIHQL